MTEAASGTPVRLHSLTGLRWIAAFVVFGFHIDQLKISDNAVYSEIVRVLFWPGTVGVPFFFLLSGLVLTWSAKPGDRPSSFWRRRVARVYPNHVVTWIVVAIGLTVLSSEAAPNAGQVISGLFLVQAWIPDFDYVFGVNTPAWSLSAEALFYASFPLLLPLLKRVRRMWIAAAGLLAAIWALPLLFLVMPHDPAYYLVWVLPFSRMLEFALGMAVALMIQRGTWRGPGLLVSGAIALGAYLTVPLLQEWGYVAWTVGPFALLLAAAAQADIKQTPSVMRRPWLVFLGEISFAFYLVHQFVIRFVVKVTGTGISAGLAIGVFVVSLAVSMLLSWALFRVVEKPMERFIRTYRTKKQRAAAAEEPAPVTAS